MSRKFEEHIRSQIVNDGAAYSGHLTSDKEVEKPVFDFFCTSLTCTRYVSKTRVHTDKKTGLQTTIEVYGFKAKVLKHTGVFFKSLCPDCGNTLVSKKIKNPAPCQEKTIDENAGTL